MSKENIESIYPLTPLQHGMLFHSNYDHRSSVYVESMNFSMRGELDVEGFKKAWQRVIDRHPALRTFFMWKNRETPLQIVRQTVTIPWQQKDWRHLSVSEQSRRLQELLKEEHEQGFDLSKAPIMRLMLISTDSDTYQFIWSYHHIILDGWSVSNVLDEVFSIYQASTEKLPVNLPEVQPYKAYVNWLNGQDLAPAKAYWVEALAGFSEPTPLKIGDLPDPGDQLTTEFSSATISLSKTTTDALVSIARQHRLTLNTIFQGAWALLLSRYCGEEDILFGAAVAGRSIPLSGIEKMVGLIIGSLPVRVQVSPEASLVPWLQDLQAKQVQARQFEYSSMRDIQSWCKFNPSGGRTLFESIISFNNYKFDNILQEKSAGLEIRDVSFREGSHYPLTMLIDPGEKLRLRMNFDRQRFEKSAIDRLLNQLNTLLEEFAAEPGRTLADCSLLSAEEKKSLLVEFNNTGVPISAEKNVVQLFEEQVEFNPDAIALRLNHQTISYAELNRSANHLASILNQKGIGKGDIVALYLDRSPDAVIAILATLKAGSGYMPIDTTLPAKRIAWMLSETKAPVILTTRKHAGQLPGLDAETIFLDGNWPLGETEHAMNVTSAAGMQDLAYIIYTSGSTGKPKGAMVRHKNLLNYVTWARDHYLQGEKLDFPLFSSLSFDLTVTSIFVPLVSGGSIVVYPEDDASSLAILDVIRDNLVDIVKLTPAHLALIKEIDPEEIRVRKMIVGGEDFKRSLALQVHELFKGRIEIYNEYGPTEATVGCMIHRFDPTKDLGPSVPIGKPIKNTQVYILDQQLKPVPVGVVGEMCIGGESVALGYLNRPGLNAEKFVDNPFQPGSLLYRTGDQARWTDDGQMQFLGRADHQVKIQGYRVELGEIESTLVDHPAVDSAVVAVIQAQENPSQEVSKKCTQCGLPDNYPGVSFDAAGVCSTCREFNMLKDRFEPYFKTPDDLRELLDRAKDEKQGKYDCIVLYSGGKDSSYMLYQLVEKFGATPLVFSIDNGYISEEAKTNIRRVTEDLGVDLVFGKTPHMNAIFVDSLKRHSNVCDGCFKVIYTLSINLAREKGIKYIFTGLTRGQLFETRLSDMFQARIFDPQVIDQTILEARRAYHRFDDAVSQLMDVRIFEDENIFDDVQLVDFYRYTDVPLQDMYQYLEENAPWVRPSDSGRSTNCLINDVGIYIHKKERGYHNYALPYSWDVRVGHKTRQEALDDLDDRINQQRVQEILAEIGYDESESRRTRLAAYYVPKQDITPSELREYLGKNLPAYMIPTHFMELDAIPLTHNGKVDRQALPRPEFDRALITTEFSPPETTVEVQLAEIWAEVLNLQQVGIHDNFFELGGDSIATIQVTMRVSQAFQIDLLPVELFQFPTIAGLSSRIEDILITELDKLSEEEAASLLASLEFSRD